MNTKPNNIYKPKKGISYYFVLLFSIACILLSCFIFVDTFKVHYPQFTGVLMAGIIGLLGLFAFYSYLNQKTIHVFDDFIELKSVLFSQKIKILKSDIISWSEFDRSNKNSNRNVLYFFTDVKKYYFDSTIYLNYDSLKIDITKNITRNTDYEENWKPKLIRKFAVILSIIGVIVLCFSYKNHSEIAQISKLSNYKQIEQIVTSEIKITKRRKGGASIDLKFKDYSEFYFYIEGSAYKITKREEFVKTVKTGDVLKFYILSEDYQKKLSKETELTFYDKYFGYYRIGVFGLTKNNYNYLKIDDCIKEEISDSNFNFWIQFYFGIILLFIGILSYVENKN